MLAHDFGNGVALMRLPRLLYDNAGAAALGGRSAIGSVAMERAVDWQELSVSSRGMSSASCYSFNLCRRDKELLFV